MDEQTRQYHEWLTLHASVVRQLLERSQWDHLQVCWDVGTLMT